MLSAVIDRVSRATPRSVLLQIALARPFTFSAGQAVLIGAAATGAQAPVLHRGWAARGRARPDTSNC